MALPKLIAHRGGREWAPENTLAAFKKSLELGVDGIEFDVQRCATGELVVFHDEDLNRTTNGAGMLRDCSFDELRRLSAGSWFAKEFHSERVPLLSEVLELVNGKCMLNIELKNAPVEYPGIEDDMLELIADYPKDTLIISSFDHKVMRTLHQKAPELEIALLADAVFVNLKETAAQIGATWFHPYYGSLRPDVAEEAKAANLKINVWTVNTQQRWREAINMNVAGIITDDPEALHEFLGLMKAAGRA